MKITPICPVIKINQKFKHHSESDAFKNILKKVENDIDIDGDNVYDKNTNNVLCNLDNIDVIILKRLLY
ncbi:hypothetical protein [Clostridium felsineum]|uniref:hypothetical protein n=1 Tax=Clostridium felsineum TaxID=36839 RepID=UPI00098CE47E|nr:hypothetical protein [Clostridium felsineum]URZ15408.1 hypothetical protein CLFE_014480 [Clostridium felsineum DSM 794]